MFSKVSCSDEEKKNEKMPNCLVFYLHETPTSNINSFTSDRDALYTSEKCDH